MAAIIIIIIIWTQFCFHENFENVLAIEKMLGLLELKGRIGEWLQFCKLIVQTSGHRCIRWWLSRRWLCGSRRRGEDRVQFTRTFSELVHERMKGRCPALYGHTGSTHSNDRTKRHPYLHVEELHNNNNIISFHPQLPVHDLHTTTVQNFTHICM